MSTLLSRIIRFTTTLANASMARGAVHNLCVAKNSESFTVPVTLLQNSSAATDDVLAVVVVVVVVSVMWIVDDVAGTDATAACGATVSTLSQGAKNAVVASLVMYFPLHFSCSVSGVSYSIFKRFSSMVMACD